jgi:hypothetical protein
MAIRFRCEHCHQLLGIARRKAGSRVECPTCHARVLVPLTDTGTTAPAPAGQEPLFERSDFDKVFQVPADEAPSVIAKGARSSPSPNPAKPRGNGPLIGGAPFDIERVEMPPGTSGGARGAAPGVPAPSAQSPPGYVLTPGRASLVTVLGILLLALAFGAGLYVGRYLL